MSALQRALETTREEVCAINIRVKEEEKERRRELAGVTDELTTCQTSVKKERDSCREMAQKLLTKESEVERLKRDIGKALSCVYSFV